VAKLLARLLGTLLGLACAALPAARHLVRCGAGEGTRLPRDLRLCRGPGRARVSGAGYRPALYLGHEPGLPLRI